MCVEWLLQRRSQNSEHGGGGKPGPGVPRCHAGGSKSCTAIDFARPRRSGGCYGGPGGSREGAGSSPEGLPGGFSARSGPKSPRSRSGLRIQRDAPYPKRHASSVTIDLSSPISSIGSKILRSARRTISLGSKTIRIPVWRPFFLRSPFLTFGVGACGRMASRIRRPQRAPA